MKKSAVTHVKKSGLDLVPARKRSGKPGTMRDYAKIDFKPWKRSPNMKEGEMFPSPEEISNHGVTCRVAYGLMLMTRDRMIDMHGTIDHDKIDDLVGNFVETGEFLKATARMVEAASIRVLATVSAALVERRLVKGVNYKSSRRKAVA